MSLVIGDGNEIGGTELVVVPAVKSTAKLDAPDVVSRRLKPKPEQAATKVEKAAIFNNFIFELHW